MKDKYNPFVATSMIPENMMEGLEEYCSKILSHTEEGIIYKFANPHLGTLQIGGFSDRELDPVTRKAFNINWGELPNFQSYFRVRNNDPLGQATLEAVAYVCRAVYDLQESFGFFLEPKGEGTRELILAQDKGFEAKIAHRGFRNTRVIFAGMANSPSSQSLDHTQVMPIYKLSEEVVGESK
ncbi:hypothetical protein HOA92_00065 [archaeon]|jgi:hypothetical protein|nr:hypothetical protein [archaeon]MBT6761414.1 hypothetical protein [archaeon]